MKHVYEFGRRLAPTLFLVVTLGVFSHANAPLHAEETGLCTQQDTPLEAARKLKAMTAGGLYNPVEAGPCEIRNAYDPDDDSAGRTPSAPLDEEHQR